MGYQLQGKSYNKANQLTPLLFMNGWMHRPINATTFQENIKSFHQIPKPTS